MFKTCLAFLLSTFAIHTFAEINQLDFLGGELTTHEGQSIGIACTKFHEQAVGCQDYAVIIHHTGHEGYRIINKFEFAESSTLEYIQKSVKESLSLKYQHSITHRLADTISNLASNSKSQITKSLLMFLVLAPVATTEQLIETSIYFGKKGLIKDPNLYFIIDPEFKNQHKRISSNELKNLINASIPQ